MCRKVISENIFSQMPVLGPKNICFGLYWTKYMVKKCDFIFGTWWTISKLVYTRKWRWLGLEKLLFLKACMQLFNENCKNSSGFLFKCIQLCIRGVKANKSRWKTYSSFLMQKGCFEQTFFCFIWWIYISKAMCGVSFWKDEM